MNRRRKKAKAQTNHTARRLRERYGLKYPQKLKDHALHCIHNDKATFVMKQSLRVTIWDIEYDVRECDIYDSSIAKVGPVVIRLVYDSNRKNLVTALDVKMDPKDRALYESF